MRILVSGAYGFVGGSLCRHFSEKGHTLVSLVRLSNGTSDQIAWDPIKGKAVKEQFEGFDAVIHLAGDPLTFSRWTHAKRKKIFFSRAIGTWFLSHILSSLMRPPQVFISASAVGFYGDRGEEILDEKSAPGDLYLSRVCVEWEKASQSLENRGTRVFKTRFGMVIGPGGGAVRKMLLPYKLGLGATLGSGGQWISWIALYDLIHAMEHLLHSDLEEGAINFVSPNPVRQKEFSQTLARLLHRPSFLNIPAPILRLALGQMADNLLLSSARAAPSKLLSSGFTFKYPMLEDALKQARLLLTRFPPLS